MWLRDPRRRQRDASDRRHRAARVSGRSPAVVRGLHAWRQLVELSAAQARHRRPAAGSRISTRSTTTGFETATATAFSGSTTAPRRNAAGHARRVVAVREGYHPFVTAYGYDAYYLNVLAGDRRSMAASDDPAHARLRRHWPPPDPRLPMVRRPRIERVHSDRFSCLEERFHETDIARPVGARCRVSSARARRVRAGRPRDAHRDRQGSVGCGDCEGAQVTVTSLATNVVAKVDEQRRWHLSGREPARRASIWCRSRRPGFQRFEQTVSLESARASRLDVSLALGSIGETVTVAGVTPLLSTEMRRARHGRGQQRSGEAAAGDSQLGRPAGDGPGRAERPLHRAGGRHLVGPHRRRQRARQPQPAEQLPARRRRQQQLLHQRAGVDHADFAAVGRRDQRVQGRDQPVRRRVRLVARRRRSSSAPSRARTLFTARPTSSSATTRSTRTTISPKRANQPKADQQAEPVRRQPRRADRARTGRSSSATSRPRASSRACCAPAAC